MFFEIFNGNIEFYTIEKALQNINEILVINNRTFFKFKKQLKVCKTLVATKCSYMSFAVINENIELYKSEKL